MIDLISIQNKNLKYSFIDAVLNPLGPNNELLIPEIIYKVDNKFIKNISDYNCKDIFLYISHKFLNGSIPKNILSDIIDDAINFELPLIELDNNLFTLELFHGPTLAFKDFGVRFLARLISYLIRNNNNIINILSATSGDTGSAVAHGFHNINNINVCLLYPSGQISYLQEKQLTMFQDNIKVFEVNGTFDDCQNIVKSAFNNKVLKNKYNFTTANSINIARLIPQICYYFYAYSQLKDKYKNIIISIPSGNYGNLTAGIIAYKMGLPISNFIASSNINDTVPYFLNTGNYIPKLSKNTISNAMDVGNPSNFIRIMHMFNYDYKKISNFIKGYSFTDNQTIEAIKNIYLRYNYIIDPHSAIGFLGIVKNNNSKFNNTNNIFFSTAHPAKFKSIIDKTLNIDIEIPDKLKLCLHKKKHTIKIDANLNHLIDKLNN